MYLLCNPAEVTQETVWEAFSESISKGQYDFEQESDTDAESIYEDLKIQKPNQEDPEKSLVRFFCLLILMLVLAGERSKGKRCLRYYVQSNYLGRF